MLKENIIAKGEVDISIFKDGKLIGRIQESNLVVTLGKTNIAKLLGGDAAGKAITQIAVGDTGTTPNIADAALTNQFAKALADITYPDTQSVLFHLDILEVDANGLTIREFGLLNSDGVLCARKIRNEAIVKTNAIRLIGTWKITIN